MFLKSRTIVQAVSLVSNGMKQTARTLPEAQFTEWAVIWPLLLSD